MAVQEKRGYLKKTGAGTFGKGWKRRWFVLSPSEGTLAYFEKEGGEKLGDVELATATEVVIQQNPLEFNVDVPGRSFAFQASDSPEAHEWVQAIRAVMKYLQQPKATQPAALPPDNRSRSARPMTAGFSTAPVPNAPATTPQTGTARPAAQMQAGSRSSAAPGTYQPMNRGPSQQTLPQAQAQPQPQGQGQSQGRVAELEADLEIKNELIESLQFENKKLKDAKALADLGIATVSPRPDPRVGELETQVADLNTLLELKEHEIQELQQKSNSSPDLAVLAKKDEQLQRVIGELRTAKGLVAQREEEVARLNARLGETESQLTQALTQPQSSAGSAGQETEIARLQSALAAKEQQMSVAVAAKEKEVEGLVAKDMQVKEAMGAKLREMREQLAAKDRELQMAKTSSAASSPQPDNAALEQLATREKEVQTLQMSLMSNQNVIQNLQANLAAKDKDIQALQQALQVAKSSAAPVQGSGQTGELQKQLLVLQDQLAQQVARAQEADQKGQKASADLLASQAKVREVFTQLKDLKAQLASGSASSGNVNEERCVGDEL